MQFYRALGDTEETLVIRNTFIETTAFDYTTRRTSSAPPSLREQGSSFEARDAQETTDRDLETRRRSARSFLASVSASPCDKGGRVNSSQSTACPFGPDSHPDDDDDLTPSGLWKSRGHNGGGGWSDGASSAGSSTPLEQDELDHPNVAHTADDGGEEVLSPRRDEFSDSSSSSSSSVPTPTFSRPPPIGPPPGRFIISPGARPCPSYFQRHQAAPKAVAPPAATPPAVVSPGGAAVPPPQPFDEAVAFYTIVHAAMSALKEVQAVVHVQLFEVTGASCRGWTLVAWVLRDKLDARECVLDTAKDALRRAAEHTENVYVMSYTNQPFVPTVLGFACMLGSLPVNGALSPCWPMLKQGRCRHREACRRQHPSALAAVSMQVKPAVAPGRWH